MTPTQYQIVTMIFAGIAAACAIFVAWRNGKWRETEEAKQLIDRVGQVENRMTKVEGQMKTLPTKEDLARLEGEVKSVGTQVQAANNGIDRLEGYFLKRGVDA